MTATPIPRTLAFTIHGDMEISWIDELPKNRTPVKTKAINGKNIELVYKTMKEEMDKGHFCYVVYPIIEESEKLIDMNSVIKVALRRAEQSGIVFLVFATKLKSLFLS